MTYELYSYRAPTEEESEHGGYCPSYAPDYEDGLTLRELIECINQSDLLSPFDCLSAIESSSYPICKGDWVSLIYQSGASHNILRPNMTPSSIGRLIKVLARYC